MQAVVDTIGLLFPRDAAFCATADNRLEIRWMGADNERLATLLLSSTTLARIISHDENVARDARDHVWRVVNDALRVAADSTDALNIEA